MERFKHIRTTIKFAGVDEPVEAIVDTGSNCSLVQTSCLAGKDSRKSHDSTSVAVDFPTVDNAMGKTRLVEVEMIGQTRLSRQQSHYTFLLFDNLSEVIPGYPKQAPVLIGTNLLSGYTLRVCKESAYVSLSPLPFEDLHDRTKGSNVFQVPTPEGQDCGKRTKMNGPFVLCETNMGAFLADTGNMRSTFCIECSKETKSVSIALTPVNYSGTDTDKPITLVNVEGMESKGKKSESIKTVENNCRVTVHGNLSKDVWVGVFEKTFFDFTAADSSTPPRIFCEYNDINR